MIVVNRENTFTYTPAPEGNHPARCLSLIDLGTQKSTFQGKEKALRKVLITFELPEETHVFKEGEAPQNRGKKRKTMYRFDSKRLYSKNLAVSMWTLLFLGGLYDSKTK